MRKLWTFGDSFTAEYQYNGYDSYSRYKDIKGYEIKTWPKILSEKFGMVLNNMAVRGSSNYDIMNSFIDIFNAMRPNDMVIIGWGLVTKFKYVQDNRLITIHPDTDDECLKKIISNRENFEWHSEIHQFIKLISNLCYDKKILVYFWSSEDPNLLYSRQANEKYQYHLNRKIISNKNETGLIYDLINKGAQTIEQETNGLIQDFHLGEDGHKFLAEFFYNYILENRLY